MGQMTLVGFPKLFQLVTQKRNTVSHQHANLQKYTMNNHNIYIYELLIKNTTIAGFKMYMKFMHLIT